MKKVKDILFRAFYRLSGGRPMTFISFRFRDVVSGKSVNIYQDQHKRKYWMANGKWNKLRVGVEPPKAWTGSPEEWFSNF